jgi:hypothetical protein
LQQPFQPKANTSTSTKHQKPSPTKRQNDKDAIVDDEYGETDDIDEHSEERQRQEQNKQ